MTYNNQMIPELSSLRISRRTALATMTVVPAATLLAGCIPAEKEPDRLVNTELGQWRFWGRRDENGALDYSTGEYTFEFPKRSLLIPRTYPNHVRVAFMEYDSIIEIVRLNNKEMHFIGAFVPQDTSKTYISQWSHWDKNPDYTQANKIRVAWKDMRFERIVWNNTTIVDRSL